MDKNIGKIIIAVVAVAALVVIACFL